LTPIFEVASKISTLWSLAAFAIAAILYLAMRRPGRGGVPPVVTVAIVAIVLLALVPIAGAFWAKGVEGRSIYRVRVIVLDPEGSPVNDARVTSSAGGEPKKVEGGWQFDIPKGSVPGDGMLTVYARIENAGLSGQNKLQLADDLNPAVTIQLARVESAVVRGIVVDASNRAIAGAKVSIVGYGSEQITTAGDGGFQLPAHGASGQVVRLHVEKDGYKAVEQDHPAGGISATVVLEAER
jgi:hypothetical protein